MVKIDGYWKVQVACLIVFVITIAVLWISGGSGQEPLLFSGCATTCIFNIFIEDDATKRLIEVIKYVS